MNSLNLDGYDDVSFGKVKLMFTLLNKLKKSMVEPLVISFISLTVTMILVVVCDLLIVIILTNKCVIDRQ